jgi:hypothetical protein
LTGTTTTAGLLSTRVPTVIQVTCGNFNNQHTAYVKSRPRRSRCRSWTAGWSCAMAAMATRKSRY